MAHTPSMDYLKLHHLIFFSEFQIPHHTDVIILAYNKYLEFLNIASSHHNVAILLQNFRIKGDLKPHQI